MVPDEERELVLALARRLREVVLPELGSHAGRVHAPGGGGDVNFAIDAAAEEELARFVAANAPELAVFSEAAGLVEPPAGAEAVLVVDPIDGTRPALAGLEAACVSVALARMDGGRPTMRDVVAGCVVEIKSGAHFVARRGGGLESSTPVSLSANEDLDRLFWTYGLRGRPVRPYAEVLGDLIDRSSAGGGCFELGSACFDMTRVLTGQLDAYVEPGPRLVDEVPGMRAEFERVGRGSVLNNTPYDLAAATLCLTEGGAHVSDAAGRPLDDRPLLGADADHQISVVASSNERLHAQLLEEVERGLARLRDAPGRA